MKLTDKEQDQRLERLEDKMDELDVSVEYNLKLLLTLRAELENVKSQRSHKVNKQAKESLEYPEE